MKAANGHIRSALLASADASALPVAAVAAALTASSFVLMGRQPEPRVLLLASSGAFLVYLLDRAWLTSPEDATNRPARAVWHHRHPAYRWLASLVAAVLAGWAMAGMPPGVCILGGVLGVFAALHLLPIFGVRLKASAFGKPMLVTLAWTGGAVLLPAISAESEDWLVVSVLAAVRILAILANVLLTDLADIKGDSQEGIRSLAGAFGAGRTRAWASVLLLVSAAFALGMGIWSSSVLWAVEVVGLLLLVALVRPARGRLPESVLLDLAVAWPAVTVAAWAAGFAV